MAFIWGQFHKRYLSHHSLKLFENYLSKIYLKSPRVQWDNRYWWYNQAQHNTTKLQNLIGHTLHQIIMVMTTQFYWVMKLIQHLAWHLLGANYYITQCWLIVGSVDFIYVSRCSEGIYTVAPMSMKQLPRSSFIIIKIKGYAFSWLTNGIFKP